MPEYPRLDHAPIIEAVIDIRFEPQPDTLWNPSAPRFSTLRELYPIIKPISRFELSTTFAPGVPPAQELHVGDAGIRLSNDTEVLQLRIDGMTFSKLKQYTSWQSVFSSAWDAWKIYRDGQKGSVTRIATRFINRMHFSQEEPVERYIRKMPNLPDEVPGGIRSFFSNHEVVFSDNSGANIIQAIEPQTGESISYILDIDAYRLGSFDPNDPLIESGFSELHGIKNKIFFSCITEEAQTKWR